MADDFRAAYEAIYAEWLDAQRLAALYKTTATRLEGELTAMAQQEQARSGRQFSTLEPSSVFGRNRK